LLERGLAEQVKQCKEAQWALENRQAIADYNAEVNTKGVFGDGWRGQL
jgi:post-segregation antitoxin (ccd killing protein)